MFPVSDKSDEETESDTLATELISSADAESGRVIDFLQISRAFINIVLSKNNLSYYIFNLQLRHLVQFKNWKVLSKYTVFLLENPKILPMKNADRAV